MIPKVFISHASEDKERFVLNFATKLRANGVDAWLDKWEMLPGDSLVDRIFEEGIGNATAFVIILSQHSVNKPWVIEELNAGFIKRISSKVKLIPVVIDQCVIPECLKSTLWETIDNLESYDENFRRIIQAIFGVTDKPEIGKSPKYINAVVNVLPSLTRIDTIIFQNSCLVALQKGANTIALREIYQNLIDNDISDEEIHESIEILDSRGYINGTRVIDGSIPFFTITHYGLETYLVNSIDDYELKSKEICLKILNENLMANYQIVENMKIPIVIVNHVIENLEMRGFVKTIKAMGGLYQITYIHPEFKRAFR